MSTILTIGLIVVILCLMIFVVYLILKNVVNNVSEQGKVYFTLKLSEMYQNDDNRNGNKEDKDNKEEIIEDDSQSSVKVVVSNESIKYEIDDLLSIVKNINNKFDVNNSAIVDYFVKIVNIAEVDTRYGSLIEIRKYLDDIGMYELLKMSENDLTDVVNKIKNTDEKIINNFNQIYSKFDIQKFKDYLNVEIKRIDPIAYILIGDKNVNYDSLSPYIKTVYNEDICKGMKVVYKNKVYDYSI